MTASTRHSGSTSPTSTRPWRGSRSRRIAWSIWRDIPTPEGRRFAAFSTSPSLYPQRSAYELTFDALKAFASRAQVDGFLPISLTAYPVGESSRFSIILEKVAGRATEMSFGLTEEALADEFDRRIKRGFSPIVLCGFTHASSVYYNIGWIQGRLPKGL